MPPSAWTTLAIILLTTILLLSNRFRADLVALLVLVTLGLTRLVSLDDALVGFSSSAVITLLAISIMTEGLQQTGISHWLGQKMKVLAGEGKTRLLVIIMLAGGTLSLFMNNIAAMAVLLPATKGLSRQKKIPLSQLLMPLAFGVIAGGMATIFTTSNLIVSGTLSEAGFPSLGMIDFFKVGAPLLLLTILYMLTIGKKLLRTSEADNSLSQEIHSQEDLLQAYRMAGSLWQVRVRFGSAMAGLSIRAGHWRTVLRLNILGITRDEKFISALDSNITIQEGDLLLAQGEPSEDKLIDYGVELLPDTPHLAEDPNLENCFGEIIVAPRSELIGKSLHGINFREKYNLTVMSLWRAGKPLHTGFAPLPLQAGDGLLVQGTPAKLHFLRQERDFIVLEEDPNAAIHPQKAPIAAAIGLITLILAITGYFPIALVSMAGAVTMILTGCLNMNNAYQAIEWKAIFLIAGMWPLGAAIQSSGLSDAIAASLLNISHSVSPLIFVAILLFVTMLLTNVIAGQSAAPIVLAPIGLVVASATHSDPRMILMAIGLGSSLAFLTPIGHPVNLLVMGAGGYAYKDFARVGWALTLILMLSILLELHFMWGV